MLHLLLGFFGDPIIIFIPELVVFVQKWLGGKIESAKRWAAAV